MTWWPTARWSTRRRSSACAWPLTPWPGGRRTARRRTDGGHRGPRPSRVLSTEAEEFLSWLAVERGRSANRRRVPPGPAWPTRRRWPRRPRPRSTPGPTTSAPSCPASGPPAAGVRGPGRSRSSGACTSSWSTRAGPTTTRPAVAGTPVPRRLPKALTEDEVTGLLDTVAGDDPLARRDRALLELLYGTGARISEASGSTSPTWPMPGDCCASTGRGPRSGWCPWAARLAGRWPQWLAPGGRDLLAPRQWRRRGDAEAVFLNARGGRLTRQGAYGILQGPRPPGPPRGPGQPARAASLVRHPHAGPGGRHPGGPRAPGPRLDLDHPALHQGVGRAPAGGLRGGPPPGRPFG